MEQEGSRSLNVSTCCSFEVVQESQKAVFSYFDGRAGDEQLTRNAKLSQQPSPMPCPFVELVLVLSLSSSRKLTIPNKRQALAQLT